jgi:hypothetical protein
MGYSGSRGVVIWRDKVALNHLESGKGHLPWSAGRVVELEAKSPVCEARVPSSADNDCY